VFLLPALEASAFVGVVFPGEIAVLLGGVLAFEHRAPLWAVIVAAIAGAVIGDSVGFEIGARWGEQVLRKIPDRLLDDRRLALGQRAIRKLGAKAVVVGRWTAALRALVPGLAGMAHMPYPRFLVANAAGGSLWATTFVLLGYFAGSGWRKVEKTAGGASLALLGVIVLLGLVVWFVKRREGALLDEMLDDDDPSSASTAAPTGSKSAESERPRSVRP
jgi:undecaprenyl-diphosphatase